MGGRRPLPTKLKIIKGTSRKSRENKNEPKPEQLTKMDPPDDLSERESKVWRGVVESLSACGLFTEVDVNALKNYVRAQARADDACEQIAKTSLIIKTSNGNIVQNPLIGVANRAMEISNRLAVEFGMTPSSRSRIKVNMPEEKPANPFDEFKRR